MVAEIIGGLECFNEAVHMEDPRWLIVLFTKWRGLVLRDCY